MITVEPMEGGDLINLLINPAAGTAESVAEGGLTSVTNGTPTLSYDDTIGMNVVTFNGDGTQSIMHNFYSVADSLRDGFAIEAFFKINEANTAENTVAFGAMQSAAFGFTIRKDGTMSFDIHNGTKYTIIYAAEPYEVGRYYHVVCVYTGSGAALYVDGKLVGEAEMADFKLHSNSNYYRLHVGADNYTSGNVESASKTTFAMFNLYSDPMTAEDVSEAYARLPHKNAVILEMKKATASEGGVYGDMGVFVQTSDPSGDYYIRYNFEHVYSTTETGNGDSTNDIDMYRIKGAELVKVTEIGDTTVTYSVITKVLHTGEIGLAIKENGAVDFVGGFHGDEHMLADGFTLSADGVTYTPGTENKVVVCTTLNINQKTVLERCNTDDQVMTHDQKYTINSTGITVLRSVEWLTSDFTLQTSNAGANSYLQLFTMYRNVDGNTVCEKVETFDKYGNSLGSAVIPVSVSNEYQTLHNADARSAKYSSATSGISATVGFKVIDDSVATNGAWIKVRDDSKGDNKWYASFSSVENGNNPKAGEVWTIKAYYTVDYVTPAN